MYAELKIIGIPSESTLQTPPHSPMGLKHRHNTTDYEKDEQLENKDNNEFSDHKTIVMESRKSVPICNVYSVADLQMATGSFSADNVIGEGLFGRVYRAEFDDGKVLAVKKINICTQKKQEEVEEKFLATVSNISRLHHPNVSEVVGYCSEHGQHLILYELHENGSLEEFLHLGDDSKYPLSWNIRVMIALGTARGLE